MQMTLTPELIAEHIETLRQFPDVLTARVAGLSEAELNTETIPGEWTVCQIVHHLADSHMNSVIRLKCILTMEQPPLIGYPQEKWAELADVYDTPIEDSLAILRGLHARWVNVWKSVREDQWGWVGIHTENGPTAIADLLPAYADHCRIHLDQIDRVLAAGR